MAGQKIRSVFRVLSIYNFGASLTRKSRSAEGEVSHAEENPGNRRQCGRSFPLFARNLGNHAAMANAADTSISMGYTRH